MSTDHISIGSITVLPHKLNTRIFHIYICQCFSACKSEFIKYKDNNLILISKFVVLLLCVKMTKPVQMLDFLSCYPVFNLFQGINDFAYQFTVMIKHVCESE